MNGEDRYVIVTDVQMKFRSMVTFMVKWAIASIPAVIILVILGSVLSVMLAGFFAGLTG